MTSEVGLISLFFDGALGKVGVGPEKEYIRKISLITVVNLFVSGSEVEWDSIQRYRPIINEVRKIVCSI